MSSYYNDSFSGSSYGTRIAIGVGVALAVAGVVLLSGYLLRRKRAAAFKSQYPVQPGFMEQGQNNAPPPMNAPAYNGYTPDTSGYNTQPQPYYAAPSPSQQMNSYPPPSSPPPNQQQHYAPPLEAPTPAANSSTSYYAPPPGPPPAPAYNPTDVK